MSLNPFIEFARDPIGILAWGGYALIMLAIAFGTVRTVLRELPTLWVQYQKGKHTDQWWAFGSRRNGYIPPLGWSIRLSASILLLAIASWSLGALLWLVGV